MVGSGGQGGAGWGWREAGGAFGGYMPSFQCQRKARKNVRKKANGLRQCLAEGQRFVG